MILFTSSSMAYTRSEDDECVYANVCVWSTSTFVRSRPTYSSTCVIIISIALHRDTNLWHLSLASASAATSARKTAAAGHHVQSRRALLLSSTHSPCVDWPNAALDTVTGQSSSSTGLCTCIRLLFTDAIDTQTTYSYSSADESVPRYTWPLFALAILTFPLPDRTPITITQSVFQESCFSRRRQRWRSHTSARLRRCSNEHPPRSEWRRRAVLWLCATWAVWTAGRTITHFPIRTYGQPDWLLLREWWSRFGPEICVFRSDRLPWSVSSLHGEINDQTTIGSRSAIDRLGSLTLPGGRLAAVSDWRPSDGMNLIRSWPLCS